MSDANVGRLAMLIGLIFIGAGVGQLLDDNGTGALWLFVLGLFSAAAGLLLGAGRGGN